ncbi:MAG: hypothetical protein Q9O24_07750 [Gammaproteobacteria bacterium]|nr:hypothetical protein [Gammaproteobacteria bacterium]
MNAKNGGQRKNSELGSKIARIQHQHKCSVLGALEIEAEQNLNEEGKQSDHKDLPVDTLHKAFYNKNNTHREDCRFVKAVLEQKTPYHFRVKKILSILQQIAIKKTME